MKTANGHMKVLSMVIGIDKLLTYSFQRLLETYSDAAWGFPNLFVKGVAF
jgi:hypothetical protein